MEADNMQNKKNMELIRDGALNYHAFIAMPICHLRSLSFALLGPTLTEDSDPLLVPSPIFLK
jgi:hypothetical protein